MGRTPAGLTGAESSVPSSKSKHTPVSHKELLRPAKTQGELMSYRQGYSAGLAFGKRHSAELVAALKEIRCVSMDREIVPMIDAAISKAKEQS